MFRGRPKIKRFVGFDPEVTYFKPAGIPLKLLQEENLLLEEVEAIRLSDLENLDQEEAAKKMNVSRVTFLRILHSAHNKIAKSLIYGKALSLKGGDYIMQNQNRFGGRGLGRGRFQMNRECVCPKCGEKVPHQRGVPCFSIKCPKCGTPMAGAFCKPQT